MGSPYPRGPGGPEDVPHAGTSEVARDSGAKAFRRVIPPLWRPPSHVFANSTRCTSTCPTEPQRRMLPRSQWISPTTHVSAIRVSNFDTGRSFLPATPAAPL